MKVNPTFYIYSFGRLNRFITSLLAFAIIVLSLAGCSSKIPCPDLPDGPKIDSPQDQAANLTMGGGGNKLDKNGLVKKKKFRNLMARNAPGKRYTKIAMPSLKKNKTRSYTNIDEPGRTSNKTPKYSKIDKPGLKKNRKRDYTNISDPGENSASESGGGAAKNVKPPIGTSSKSKNK